MEREDFDSDAIASAGWANFELEVEFTDGSVYTYQGVSPLVWANFLRVLSKGWFFNKYIRNRYSFTGG